VYPPRQLLKNQLRITMPASFGTSGLRGLVTELTPELVTDYVQAFLAVCPHGNQLFVAQDLRDSSPRIAADVLAAAQAAGIDAVDCGALPTPALALASMSAGAAAIMVTGSHIPADRNGLKFYLPDGEISKADEARISAAYAARQTADHAGEPSASGSCRRLEGAEATYVNRYVDAFGAGALSGMRIGVYRHSSVAREVMQDALVALGAIVVPLGHSEVFIPVDTEAVSPEMRGLLVRWCQDHGLDAIASTDGDADRPLLTDATGHVIPGDVLGVLTSRLVGAEIVVTPVSSNDMVRRLPEFSAVTLTRIGSPFVIAGMQAAQAERPGAAVVGFEANGGYLLGFEATLPGPLAPLPTRDGFLPILAPLVAARQAGVTLAELIAQLPPCFTAAERVQEINRSKADQFLATLIQNEKARATFFATVGEIDSVDLTDGLRVDFTGGEVLHLRPSGNAPEFRIYAQAASEGRALELVGKGAALVTEQVL
jgi:phosphomannomutase